MKLLNIVVLVLAALAAMLAGANANPKISGNAIRKGGKIIKHGLGAIGAIGTGHEVYQQWKNRHQG